MGVLDRIHGQVLYVVPATEVLSLVQHTLCLVGNSSELVSQIRRSKILEAGDLSWAKYGTDDFPSAKAMLFGEEFQENLTKSVEKDSALSKALSISRKEKKEHTTLSSLPSTSHSRGKKSNLFFLRRPSCQLWEQAGQKLYPVQCTASPIKGRRTQPMEATTVPIVRWLKGRKP